MKYPARMKRAQPKMTALTIPPFRGPATPPAQEATLGQQQQRTDHSQRSQFCRSGEIQKIAGFPLAATTNMCSYGRSSFGEVRMGATEIRHAIAIAVQVGQPVLLWGDPGGGKTSVVEQLASALGRPVEVVIGSLREASDFAGLPVRTDDGVTFVPPRWAQRCVNAPNSVVFLDELTTAPPSVQAAMLRVVLERQVGDLQLPSEVAIVAAANPPETSAGGDDLSAPLANRFLHLTWDPDPREWSAGLLSGWKSAELPMVPEDFSVNELRWRSLLAAFITARPSVLHAVPSDIGAQGRAWPSPRSWAAAYRVVAAAEAAGASRRVQQLLTSGLVGMGPAMEFMRYAEQADLPDPEAVLADPTLLRLDRRSDLVLATLAAVTAAVAAECTEERWNAGWAVLAHVCDQGVADMAALAANHLLPLRDPSWPAPATATAFLPILREAALV